MKVARFKASLRALDSLAQAEYKTSLTEIATQPGDNSEHRLLRMGRLLGVILKEPFATCNDRKKPSSFTGAYRAWQLRSEAFDELQTQKSWQYKVLEDLGTDPDVIESLGGSAGDPRILADFAQHERGFFWFLAMACRRYLCEDTELRKDIEREFETARQSGIDLVNVTPEEIVAFGGFKVGTMLIQAIPVLKHMEAPVIAGLVFILYSVGMDTFCRWAKAHEFFHPGFPNPDQEE
jgi:hypothetical protein